MPGRNLQGIIAATFWNISKITIEYSWKYMSLRGKKSIFSNWKPIQQYIFSPLVISRMSQNSESDGHPITWYNNPLPKLGTFPQDVVEVSCFYFHNTWLLNSRCWTGENNKKESNRQLPQREEVTQVHPETRSVKDHWLLRYLNYSLL